MDEILVARRQFAAQEFLQLRDNLAVTLHVVDISTP
jgi:hypothetical protein